MLVSVYVCQRVFINMTPQHQPEPAAHRLQIFNHVPASPGKLLPRDGNR